MFNLDPKKMQAVMKQMGISQKDIPASKVIIEKQDGGRIKISNPNVARITMQGQDSFQITGDVSEEQPQSQSEPHDILEEDIATVMEKTGASKKQAKQALEQADGDLAEAILKLSE